VQGRGEAQIVARMERSEIRGRSPGQIVESRIALRAIRATLAAIPIPQNC